MARVVGDPGFGRRRTGKRRNPRKVRREPAAVGPGLLGGAYHPLSDHDIERVHGTVLDVLANIGLLNPLPILREAAIARGCRMNDKNRLCFPRALVEDVIAGAGRNFVLHARDPAHDTDVSDTRVHFSTGGQAVSVVDFETGHYRPSTLLDYYDFARLADQLEHIHHFTNVVVATELPDPRELDLNRCYAAAAGTAKGFGMSCTKAANIDEAVAMFDLVLGGEGRFLQRPFCVAGGCAIVSPLCYGDDNSEIVVRATQLGIPTNVVVASQAGATAPAALAGALAQNTAETLAGLLLVNLIRPGHPMIFGNWPFISDLRTGAFSGGGGEEAVLSAAAAQMANFYDLPGSVAAGMTDSKLPDDQAGYEKGLTTALAGLAGANFVGESAGMLGSLMGASFETMVIDNEMLGSVQRAIRGIEVTEDTLSYEVIAQAVDGPGHFLGTDQTLALMRSEYLYPSVGDRSAPGDWEESGANDIRKVARERARELLATHYPEYIPPGVDEKIRERFPIRLPREAMRAASGRC